MDAFTRVTNPRDLPRLYKAVGELQRLLTVFAANFGMPEMGDIQRKAWRESVLSLGQQAGHAVAGAVTAAAEGVAAVPKAIGGGVEDTILHAAKNIERRRQSQGTTVEVSEDLGEPNKAD